MDVSVLASIGSFYVSESFLKPKASVLVILGCVLAYDLTTKTHDSSSLRVYRGPALMAFTLIMCAYSLRTWRRNGVACDELIFLPGTPHGERHGVEDSATAGGPIQQSSNSTSAPTSLLRTVSEGRSGEGDVAAGVATVPAPRGHRRSQSASSGLELVKKKNGGSKSGGGMMTSPPSGSTMASSSPSGVARTDSFRDENSTISSMQDFAYSWDEDDDDNLASTDVEAGERDEEQVALTESYNRDNEAAGSGRSEPASRSEPAGPVQRFRENHPRITRIGSFFFFRSSVTSTHNATYAPSGPSVVGAAIDLSLPILFNFHLFIEAYNHIEQYGSETPAKILPLIFLSVLIVRSFIPPGRRGRFYSVVKFTAMTPFHRVLFRDAYIGDVLTSLVRPFQDVLFALSYYVTVIWGMISGDFGLSESGDHLQSSWLLHNVVLPSAALLPLWWKFLQTLRQAYDTGYRWPHLGNAFKYLTAALTILYGMTHPEDRRSSWWIVSFVFCVLYQIWWDVVMDWELLVITPRSDESVDLLEQSWFSTRSSFRADSYVLYLQMLLVQPLKDALRYVLTKFPKVNQVQLRSRRLYKTDAFYWRILAYNACFRFAWMLCFIPAYHLSASGEEYVPTFSSDTNSYVGVLLPVTEILRRTFWGFLLLEKETIKMQDGDPSYAHVSIGDDQDFEEECSERSPDSENSKFRTLPGWMLASQPSAQVSSNVSLSPHAISEAVGTFWRKLLDGEANGDCITFSDGLRHKLFIAELVMWAVGFVVLGLWATN